MQAASYALFVPKGLLPPAVRGAVSSEINRVLTLTDPDFDPDRDRRIFRDRMKRQVRLLTDGKWRPERGGLPL